MKSVFLVPFELAYSRDLTTNNHDSLDNLHRSSRLRRQHLYP